MTYLELGIYLVGVVIGGVFLYYFLPQLAQDVIDIRRFSRMKVELRGAIIHNQPSWKEICQVAKYAMLKKTDLYAIIRGYMREIITQKNSSLVKHKALIQGYITSYESTEPFEGLKAVQVRLYLERLSRENADTDTLHALAGEIAGMEQFTELTNRKQRFYTFGGFVIGIIGVLLAVYPMVKVGS
ncbi:hypothetical protein [Pseudomonas alabamensis]|uniref:hypothetical protein n=1 Tax=Pseudomonas alabamensis TaxID=3064349 RepID=UPI0011AA5F7F